MLLRHMDTWTKGERAGMVTEIDKAFGLRDGQGFRVTEIHNPTRCPLVSSGGRRACIALVASVLKPGCFCFLLRLRMSSKLLLVARARQQGDGLRVGRDCTRTKTKCECACAHTLRPHPLPATQRLSLVVLGRAICRYGSPTLRPWLCVSRLPLRLPFRLPLPCGLPHHSPTLPSPPLPCRISPRSTHTTTSGLGFTVQGTRGES